MVQLAPALGLALVMAGLSAVPGEARGERAKGHATETAKAGAEPAGIVPLPRERPRPEGVPADAPAAEAIVADEPPQPIPLPPSRPAELGGGGGPPPPADADVPSAGAGCTLESFPEGFSAEVLPPIRAGACSVADPLLVRALPGGVKLEGPATLSCGLAHAVASFVAEVAQPRARDQLGTRLAAVTIGTSYQCRSQNNVGGAKLSEHATGNGLDLAAFLFADGRRAEVGKGKDDDPLTLYVQALRKAACDRFTTVLGPGSDAEHGNHLHVDLRARRSGYRICQ